MMSLTLLACFGLLGRHNLQCFKAVLLHRYFNRYGMQLAPLQHLRLSQTYYLLLSLTYARAVLFINFKSLRSKRRRSNVFSEAYTRQRDMVAIFAKKLGIVYQNHIRHLIFLIIALNIDFPSHYSLV